MRKLFPLFLALMTTTSLRAYDFQSGDLYYNITSDTSVEVTYQDFLSSNNYFGLTTATIPETVTYNGKNYSVTNIGNDAFSRCTGLTYITIPNSITSIGDYALSGCSGLKSITIPNSVISIGNNAFNQCSGFTSITIPNSVTNIGNNVFSQCSSLTSITIPNSLISIGKNIFSFCDSLISIIVENGNTIYDSRNNCNAIIETATNTLIAGCQNTTIPNSVINIGEHAFEACYGLTSIVVQDGNANYDSRNNCNAIIETATNTLIAGCQNTTIPNSIISIEDYAFEACYGLTSIIIPNSVTSIGKSAFLRCTGLTSITIPNSVTAIGESAFGNCSSLTSITIPNGIICIEDWVFSLCSSITSITIGNSVTNIGQNAFFRCTGLTSVTIPNSVTCIEDYAFGDCSSLLTIICHAAEVPELVGWNIFSNIPLSDATLYIPAESLEDYKAADQWKEFGTILPLEDAPDAVENIQSPTANGTIVIRDGQLLILRDGKTYSMMGQEM